MSRLLVVISPSLVSGFRIAGVEAFAAEDPEDAEKVAISLLEASEKGLLAIGTDLLDGMSPSVVRRLEDSKDLQIMAIPGGDPIGSGASRRGRIIEMIRRAIGFHMTFRRQGSEAEEE